MTVIGLAGPSGAGKTTALKAAFDLGASVYDCDRIYAQLLKSDGQLLSAIDDAFPGTVVGGALDRRELAGRVFSDMGRLLLLNSITHPAILKKVESGIACDRNSGRSLAVIDAVELFDSGLSALCDVTVFITAPKGERIARITRRDSITESRAGDRVNIQKPDEYFEGRCDIKIVNNFPDRDSFFEYCREFFRRYIK